jgi:hypothetical protein
VLRVRVRGHRTVASPTTGSSPFDEAASLRTELRDQLSPLLTISFRFRPRPCRRKAIAALQRKLRRRGSKELPVLEMVEPRRVRVDARLAPFEAIEALRSGRGIRGDRKRISCAEEVQAAQGGDIVERRSDRANAGASREEAIAELVFGDRQQQRLTSFRDALPRSRERCRRHSRERAVHKERQETRRRLPDGSSTSRSRRSRRRAAGDETGRQAASSATPRRDCSPH